MEEGRPVLRGTSGGGRGCKPDLAPNSLVTRNRREESSLLSNDYAHEEICGHFVCLLTCIMLKT